MPIEISFRERQPRHDPASVSAAAVAAVAAAAAAATAEKASFP